MGGTNEIRILGYWAHANNGSVHLHAEDGMKFERDIRGFKEDLEEAIESLRGVDGAVAVTGRTSVSLIVGRAGRQTFTALTVDGNAADDLFRWAEGC